MTWDATWIVASAQSTSFPFIQILPVPEKAIGTTPSKKLSTYCASPQNGQRAERACSGLRQCQQKRGSGVSRARRRFWISWAFSDGVVTEGEAAGAARGTAGGVVLGRAASRSVSRSLA